MINWKDYIILNKVSSGCYTVAARSNDVIFAEFLMGDDGYWNCWFDSKKRYGGYLPDNMLLALGYSLKELNEPWEQQIASRHYDEYEHKWHLEQEALSEGTLIPVNEKDVDKDTWWP